ncbi:hypothetical protein [Streptomyces sp. NPDC089919]|uniref:hypothetical protein n=1 Tax=Streptomyces sp. NPDC089919 TaxID=3155188 RepID=UPI0034226DE1
MSGTVGRRRADGRGARAAGVLLLALAAVLAVGLRAAPGASAAPAPKPTVELALQEVAKGTEVTVAGTGWPARTLLMLLVCGQNMIGGTNTCANSDGRAVTTDAAGRFGKQLPVVGPPKPCPCVVHVATVTGDQAEADAPVKITDHPVAALPSAAGSARLAVLAAARLEGDDGVLTWFGAPPERRLVVTVGNLGSAAVKNPVFQVGTAHGVFAPLWEERAWKGTIAPGGKARVSLPVSLDAGAYGDYSVSLKYGEKTLVTQPWGVDRPYGVTLFWILLCLVVPAGVFRIGMAVVDKVRPRPDGGAAPGPGRHRGAAGEPEPPAAVTARLPRIPAAFTKRPAAAEPAPPPEPPGASDTTTTTTAVLPWFTPDTAPGAPQTSAPSTSAPQTSAPSENRSTTKGHS